jgi:hypothetical protein
MMQENDDFFLSLFLSLCQKGVVKSKACLSQKNKKIKKGRSSEKKTKKKFWTDFHHKPSTHKPHISYIHAWVKTLFEHTHNKKESALLLTCG